MYHAEAALAPNCGTRQSALLLQRFLWGDLAMKKVIAEFIGTFALVFIGCGTVVVGGMATGSTTITELAIAIAFGLSIVAMAYGIGQISGCHVNPAVSFGVYTAGRMSLKELLAYCMAQVAGAIAAALDSVGQGCWVEWGVGPDHMERI